MKTPSWKKLAVAAIAASLVTSMASPSALAAPLSATNGQGGTVTLDSDSYLPGDRIELTGTGFVTDTTTSGAGNPVIAVKINDNELPAGWEFGGDSAVDISDFFDEGVASFQVVNGDFDGWIQIPSTAAEGKYSLRFLGGSLSTVGANTGVRLQPQSFVANISVGASATITYAGHAPEAAEGLGAVKVSLRNFTRQDNAGGQKVAFKIDGTGDVLACVQTDADGNVDNTPVPLPAGITAGTHTLNILAGSACGEGAQAPSRSLSLEFTPAIAEVVSSDNYPGGRVAVDLSGFTRSDGLGGQKIAFKVDAVSGGNQPTLACAQTDEAGNANNFSIPLPDDISLGAHTLNILAGSACGEGSQAPGRSLPVTFNVVEQPALSAQKVPTISGTATVGQTLRASTGSWNYSDIEIAGYQWYRGNTAIKGATQSSYTLTVADYNATIKVAVTAVHAHAGRATTTSNPTARVRAGKLVVVKKPAIKGKARVGAKLKATTGTWKPRNVKVSYQWLRGSKVIKKATKATYTLKKADRKKRISVRVTARTSGYNSAQVTSKKTSKVKKAKVAKKASRR